MSKHTPGPWFTKREGFSTVYIDARIGGGFLQEVAAVGSQAGGIQQQEATAQLIAASPDLYAVLKELQESADYWSEYDVPLGIVDRINQAIAKAEGNA